MKNFYLTLDEMHKISINTDQETIQNTFKKLTKEQYKKYFYKGNVSIILLIEAGLINHSNFDKPIALLDRLKSYRNTYILNCLPNIYSQYEDNVVLYTLEWLNGNKLIPIEVLINDIRGKYLALPLGSSPVTSEGILLLLYKIALYLKDNNYYNYYEVFTQLSKVLRMYASSRTASRLLLINNLIDLCKEDELRVE